ncbi:MAG: hypothetical protein JST00_26430 [Deltaproteobacteria bacterium]|nr:hypothetical protein [Deltaproteobacteria bacterium]
MVPASAVASSMALARGPDPRSSSATSPSDGPLSRGDRLTGHYFCIQGRTELTLVIEDARGDEIEAIFEFVYRGGTPGHAPAEGSYRMHGTLDRRTGKLALEAGDWIAQPQNYATVDLEGTLSTDPSGTQTYRGRVKPPGGVGCSTFHVTRRAVLPSR